MSRPMIKAGDVVQCLVNYYKSYQRGELATVKRVEFSSAGNVVLVLANHLSDCGESIYSIGNFKLFKAKEEDMTHYKKTKYFAVKLNREESEAGELCFERPMTKTTLRNTRSEVMKDVGELTCEDETWVVLQTVCMVEPKKPEKPRVALTVIEDYR